MSASASGLERETSVRLHLAQQALRPETPWPFPALMLHTGTPQSFPWICHHPDPPPETGHFCLCQRHMQHRNMLHLPSHAVQWTELSKLIDVMMPGKDVARPRVRKSLASRTGEYLSQHCSIHLNVWYCVNKKNRVFFKPNQPKQEPLVPQAVRAVPAQ